MITKTSKFRLFAGPNGSGKSTLISEINESFNLGVFVNADLIEYELRKSKFIELSTIFGKNTISEIDWKAFYKKYQIEDSRAVGLIPDKLEIQEGVLIWKSEINSYAASIIASFFRFELLRRKTTFSFETVMSHPSKVHFMQDANAAEFKTYLYFICTEDPLINLQRVRNRKEMGGHDVPEHLIESRYYRSLEQLHTAFLTADRAFVIDSSNRNRNLILEKNHKTVTINTEAIPGLVDEYLVSKIKLK